MLCWFDPSQPVHQRWRHWQKFTALRNIFKEKGEHQNILWILSLLIGFIFSKSYQLCFFAKTPCKKGTSWCFSCPCFFFKYTNQNEKWPKLSVSFVIFDSTDQFYEDVCMVMIKKHWLQPPKFNMEPESDGFQKESDFSRVWFSGEPFILNFTGVSQIFTNHIASSRNVNPFPFSIASIPVKPSVSTQRGTQLAHSSRWGVFGWIQLKINWHIPRHPVLLSNNDGDVQSPPQNGI